MINLFCSDRRGVYYFNFYNSAATRYLIVRFLFHRNFLLRKPTRDIIRIHSVGRWLRARLANRNCFPSRTDKAFDS